MPAIANSYASRTFLENIGAVIWLEGSFSPDLYTREEFVQALDAVSEETDSEADCSEESICAQCDYWNQEQDQLQAA